MVGIIKERGNEIFLEYQPIHHPGGGRTGSKCRVLFFFKYYSWQWWKRKSRVDKNLTCLHRSVSEMLKMHALLNWAIALSDVRTLFLDNSLIALHSFSFTQKIKDHSSLLSVRSIYKSDVPSSGYTYSPVFSYGKYSHCIQNVKSLSYIDQSKLGMSWHVD